MMSVTDKRLRELGIKPIRGRYVPATAAEVEELEGRLGCSLSPDYKHFLLTYGYARFDEVVSVALPGGDHEAPIAIFFGGGDSAEPVLKQLDDYEDQFEAGVLPIARDPFGNLFLLEVRGADSDGVWYANFTDHPEPVPVADSFEDFLNRATVDPDDE